MRGCALRKVVRNLAHKNWKTGESNPSTSLHRSRDQRRPVHMTVSSTTLHYKRRAMDLGQLAAAMCQTMGPSPFSCSNVAALPFTGHTSP